MWLGFQLYYIKIFCFICSQVDHYFFFIYEFGKLCPRKIGLSSSYLSPVKTIIGVPGKVVYLHYTTVYCNASLSCSLPFVPVETYPDDYLVGKELVIQLFECVVGKMFCCVLCIFFPSWCLCWDFKFNCTKS